MLPPARRNTSDDAPAAAPSPLRVLLMGSVQGRVRQLHATLEKYRAKQKIFDVVFCVGQFTSDDMDMDGDLDFTECGPVYFTDSGPAVQALVDEGDDEILPGLNFLGHSGVTELMVKRKKDPATLTSTGGGATSSSTHTNPEVVKLKVGFLSGISLLRRAFLEEPDEEILLDAETERKQKEAFEERVLSYFQSDELFVDGCYTKLCVDRLREEIELENGSSFGGAGAGVVGGGAGSNSTLTSKASPGATSHLMPSGANALNKPGANGASLSGFRAAGTLSSTTGNGTGAIAPRSASGLPGSLADASRHGLDIFLCAEGCFGREVFDRNRALIDLHMPKRVEGVAAKETPWPRLGEYYSHTIDDPTSRPAPKFRKQQPKDAAKNKGPARPLEVATAADVQGRLDEIRELDIIRGLLELSEPRYFLCSTDANVLHDEAAEDADEEEDQDNPDEQGDLMKTSTVNQISSAAVDVDPKKKGIEVQDAAKEVVEAANASTAASRSIADTAPGGVVTSNMAAEGRANANQSEDGKHLLQQGNTKVGNASVNKDLQKSESNQQRKPSANGGKNAPADSEMSSDEENFDAPWDLPVLPEDEVEPREKQSSPQIQLTATNIEHLPVKDQLQELDVLQIEQHTSSFDFERKVSTTSSSGGAAPGGAAEKGNTDAGANGIVAGASSPSGMFTGALGAEQQDSHQNQAAAIHASSTTDHINSQHFPANKIKSVPKRRIFSRKQLDLMKYRPSWQCSQRAVEIDTTTVEDRTLVQSLIDFSGITANAIRVGFTTKIFALADAEFSETKATKTSSSGQGEQTTYSTTTSSSTPTSSKLENAETAVHGLLFTPTADLELPKFAVEYFRNSTPNAFAGRDVTAIELEATRRRLEREREHKKRFGAFASSGGGEPGSGEGEAMSREEMIRWKKRFGLTSNDLAAGHEILDAKRRKLNEPKEKKEYRKSLYHNQRPLDKKKHGKDYSSMSFRERERKFAG
ncbi:unnamed protein product [Amoebophrya sp. A25]|nr:unnamed protein product [Amoebophrya sp. A25]|eukprot:GSA25T00021506001.1